MAEGRKPEPDFLEGDTWQMGNYRPTLVSSHEVCDFERDGLRMSCCHLFLSEWTETDATCTRRVSPAAALRFNAGTVISVVSKVGLAARLSIRQTSLAD